MFIWSLNWLTDAFSVSLEINGKLNNVEGTSIDLCLVSKPLRFKATLNLDCWLSDFHNFICIVAKLNMPRRSPNVIRYRSYKNFDQSKLKYDIHVILEIMSSVHNNVNLCTRAFCE